MFPDPAIPTVLTRFGINPEGVNVKRITQGYINASFLISEVGTPKYVLQRINTAVFGQPGLFLHDARDGGQPYAYPWKFVLMV